MSEETLRMSVRKVLGNITDNTSKTSVHTISVMQYLKDSDIDIESRLRVQFAHSMKENDETADVIWFSDEAHFHLNAQVNKRNCRFWRSEKPDGCQLFRTQVISYRGHFVPTLVISYLVFGHFVPINNHFVPRSFRTHFGHFVPRSTGYEMTIWWSIRIQVIS